jgi:hypothetical protein
VCDANDVCDADEVCNVNVMCDASKRVVQIVVGSSDVQPGSSCCGLGVKLVVCVCVVRVMWSDVSIVRRRERWQLHTVICCDG